MADQTSLRLSDGFGLNKERRLRALNTDKAPILQVPFPFEVIGFADRHFGAQSSEPDPQEPEG